MIQSRHAREVRKRAYEYAMYLYAHRTRLFYAEVRPMRSFPTPWLHLPRAATDCSESTAIILQASGAPTPYVIEKLGYTGTMLARLPHIRRWFARRGDLVCFKNAANPGGVHVVMLLQGCRWHRDPLVWSHGGPGVDLMPLSHMAYGFPGFEMVFLRAVPLRLRKP